MSPLLPLRVDSAAEWLVGLPPRGLVLLYKHSPICGTSRRAEKEVIAFGEAHPEIPVYLLDVIEQRPLSRELAEKLGVTHESPQAILLGGPSVMWHGSHGEITAEELESRVAARRTGQDT
jgi:bacillithiol system protein YtxJ